MNNHQFEISLLEKRKLRQHKIKLASIHETDVRELQRILDISKIRAMELFALSEFQSLPSIGPRFAMDLISMGYFSLNDLKKENGARLLDKYEKQVGVWTDPCVEDQFRLVVHAANNRSDYKNWWDFTDERKAFREKNGYPKSRPKKAWHEMEQYQRSAKVSAIKNDTKKDLFVRLKGSANYMNKYYGEKLTLKDIAKAAALSSHHYIRQFKNVYEITPIQYLTHIRLKKATSLLRNSNLSVGAICQQCGFENESSFIRLFKTSFSKTPLYYRKEKLAAI